MMGYNLHITRRASWADEGGLEITFDEWAAYLKSDNELQPDAINGPTDFLCIAISGESWPLWWNRGEIYTKNPNKAAIRKLVEIARKLEARVVGDEGETYS